MKTLHFLGCLLLLGLAPAMAQDTPAGEEGNGRGAETAGPDRFWQATLPGGHYMVALDRISTVSLHEYLLDGGVIVREVTIDAGGKSLARFYHLAPVTDEMRQNGLISLAGRGRELLENAGQRAGIGLHEMAQKSYPTTTHAGTVEYRLRDAADLDALYESVRKAWIDRRGRQFTLE